MSRWTNWKRRHRYAEGTQDPKTGEWTERERWLHRWFSPLVKHWLEHWHRWLAIAAAGIGAYAALVRALTCR